VAIVIGALAAAGFIAKTLLREGSFSSDEAQPTERPPPLSELRNRLRARPPSKCTLTKRAHAGNLQGFLEDAWGHRIGLLATRIYASQHGLEPRGLIEHTQALITALAVLIKCKCTLQPRDQAEAEAFVVTASGDDGQQPVDVLALSKLRNADLQRFVSQHLWTNGTSTPRPSAIGRAHSLQRSMDVDRCGWSRWLKRSLKRWLD
jgi:hypothetical protein